MVVLVAFLAWFLVDGYLIEYSFCSYTDLLRRLHLRHRLQNFHHRRAGDPVWDFYQLGARVVYLVGQVMVSLDSKVSAC